MTASDRVRILCPRDSWFLVSPADVDLQVCSTDADRSYYSADCPVCTSEIRRKAPAGVVLLLTTGGVVPHYWDIPAEALEQHSGPVISFDDVLDFALAIEGLDSGGADQRLDQPAPPATTS